MKIKKIHPAEEKPSELSPAPLYIVPTPIGHLADISQRALDTLAHVDLIAAEDTRHTNKLLIHFNITTKAIALHNYNEEQKIDDLIQRLLNGQKIALVSDAGTPLISDPGYLLVSRCRALAIPVIPLPGPCALITALSASGLAADRFYFAGFLPAKSKARQDTLQGIAANEYTSIFYESPHRILDSLEDMRSVLGGERFVVMARELTKTFETIHGAPLDALIEWVRSDSNQQRGEMVLLIQGKPAQAVEINEDAMRAMTILVQELPLKKAAAVVAQLYSLKKNMLYQWGLTHLKAEE